MKRIVISKEFFYRNRYRLGYIAYGVLVFMLYTLDASSIPRGISQAEMSSSTTSAYFSLDDVKSGNLVDTPYHLLQKASLNVFHLTPLGIRLPSIILAVATTIILALMLKRWFKGNTALLTGVIVATSVPLLTLGHIGTPDIMMIFWMILLLLIVSHLLYNPRFRPFWKVSLAITVSLSLFTPLSVYPIASLAIGALIHPHIRYTLRHLRPRYITIALVLGTITAMPLLWMMIRQPHTILTLLGISRDLPSWSQLGSSVQMVLQSITGIGATPLGVVATPLIGVAGMALILYGVFRVFYHRHTARSYMILLWSAFLIPVTLWDSQNFIAYFVPATLLLAIGIDGLFSEWYSIFPLNPYARVLALFPLAILLGSISISGTSHYFQSQLYNPKIAPLYHTTLQNVRESVKKDNRPTALVTTESSRKFYSLLQREFPHVTALTQPSTKYARTIVLEDASEKLPPIARAALGKPYRILTNGFSDNALELRIYHSPTAAATMYRNLSQ